MAVEGPFDFLNSINSPSKENIIEDKQDEKKYLPYIVNRSLSYHQDTVMLANEMNCNHQLPEVMQYDFLRLTVRPKKRFAKWIKPEQNENINLLIEAYSMNRQKAEEALKIISSEELQRIKESQFRGGKQRNK